MKNETIYKLIFSFNLDKAVGEIGEFCETLSSAISNSGSKENVHIRANVLTMALKTNRQLTQKERRYIMNELVSGLDKQFPDFGFKVESMRRQSYKSCGKSESR